MAIDARCPFCTKIYRLKDDLAGKKVTCANHDCRKIFPVVALDADAIAAAALAEESVLQAPVENRTIAMACVICEHKWTAPWEMQGKNVLCPECKHRQKVPEQKAAKAADWRTGGGGPSMAKRETLENVTSARDTAMVSGDTLLKTGVIDDGVEPVPVKVKLLRYGGVALVLLAVGIGIYSWRSGRGARDVEKTVDKFIEAANAEEFKSLPLHRSILHMAGGEYMLRQDKPETLERAIDLFGSAYTDLSDAPKGYDRDCLTAELALAMLMLGGDGDAVKDKKRLPWTPQAEGPVLGQVRSNRADADGVVGQLRRPLELLQKKGADFEFRAWTTRRLARELIAKGQIDVLRANLGAAFTEGETLEIQGQIGLELYRAGKLDAAKEIAEFLLGALANNPPTGPPAVSAPALWALFDMKALPEPVTESTRFAATAKHLAKKEHVAAVDAAAKAGPVDSRLRALALCAEWSDDPTAAFDAADKVAAEVAAQAKTDPNVAMPALPPARLAIAAAKTGDDARATKYAGAISDPAFREYITSEILRHKLAKDRKAPAAETLAPLPQNPENPKEFLAGHAWGRYHLARHNGFVEGAGLAKKLSDTWPKPLVAPFGAAGAMLGAQDKSVAP